MATLSTQHDHPQSIYDTQQFASLEELEGQLNSLEGAAATAVLLGLVPAIQVAWADGRIQDEERALILALAERHGLSEDAAAMEQIGRWLEAPPSHEEVEGALRELRGISQQGDGRATDVERALDWARAVARAEGGVFGIGSISVAERRALAHAEAALNPAVVGAARGAATGALQVMREFLRDRVNADTQHADLVPRGEVPRLPQPSPFPGMPPAVFAVPESDYQAYMAHIIPRYVRALRDGWWDALRFASSEPGVAPMDDHELARLIGETPFSRFLVPTLDPIDTQRFAEDLARAPEGTLYKVDQSHFAAWRTLPGMNVAPTVGLYAAKGDALRPLAIALRDKVFRPGDGEAWARARYFHLQGCSLSIVVGIHPFLHFPMDSVIAVTREVLPAKHPVTKLVEAHAYLHLPLDYGVQWNPRSVAHNHQTEVYTPFPVRREDIFQGIASFYAGIPGNSGYPGFRYPMEGPRFFGPYCRFLGRYYDVVLGLCRRVAAARPFGPEIERWGTLLHDLLPGFPEGAALADPEVLARALAGFVHSVAVWHSTEHHTYSQEPVTRVPQRLRVPEPVGGDAAVPLAEWTRPVDIARQEMARRMFYEAHPVRTMLQVEYGFEEPSLATAQQDFFDALRACDARQRRRYIDLDRMACSLQY